VTVLGKPLNCLSCGGSAFWDRELKMDTTGPELLDLGWANRSSLGLVCAACGYVHARPTRCAGWSVGDLVFHVLADAQRALVAVATPAQPPPDRSFVTWQDFPSGSRDERQTAATSTARAGARTAGAAELC
jgi:hypothetical protein